METSEMQTLTLDSTTLYRTAKNSPNLSPPNSPIPASVPHCQTIPKTRFLVDAFRHAGAHSFAYFLSHFHADHYTGLTPNWSKGIIFCSEITARLVETVLGVPCAFIHPLVLRQWVAIDGCEVTIIDANHCPGAVQFLFKVGCERYVHTGDFRYCGAMRSDSCLSEFVGCDGVFLDTTYCNPKFLFPTQDESIDYVVDRVSGVKDKGVLFLVATYVIGKEKILVEVARRCKRRVHVDARKMVVLRALGHGDSGVFTEDMRESDVHVVGWNVLGETWPYFRPNFTRVKEIMRERGYSKVVGFVPTGWTYEVKRNKFAVRSKGELEIHLVPYSEHSNYDELREYVRFLKPKRVIPTVGLDVEKSDSKHVGKMRKYFSGLIDEMANRKEFIMGFHRGSVENDEKDRNNALHSINEELNKKELQALSKTEDIDNTKSGCISERGPVCVDINDEEKENFIKQLRDTLPGWVTQEQISDLFGSSCRNIVEAVSYFYEHESEFYEQASVSTTSVSAPINNSSYDSLVLSVGNKLVDLDVPASQAHKPHNRISLVNSSISPGKKKKGDTESKSNKKRKTISKIASTGPKQATITKFFTKTLPGVPKCGEVGLESEPCPKMEIISGNDASKRYEEETDQIIQIINGNESHRSDVASILERTKGDINMALNIYYNLHEDKLDGKEERKPVSGKALQVQLCSDTSTSSKETDIPDRTLLVADLSVKDLLNEAVDTNVSLPPQEYNPIDHACWEKGQPAPYLHLARTFDLVEREKGKIKAISMLCNMFRSLLALSPEDVLPAVYLCTNKIAADHENMELNIGGSLVSAALEEACGTKRLKIREMYNSLGDLGDVAQTCRQTQALLAPPTPLKICDVFSVLRRISVQTGSGSISRKKTLILNLMRSCREKEMKFLVRTLVRNLRIGAMMRTVLPALAQAVVMNSVPKFNYKGAAKDLKEKLQYLSAAVIEAFNIVPNLDLVVPALMEKGIEFGPSSLSMAPGIPIKPMLAKITNGVSQALKLFQNKAFTCEYKYDGQRAQIHKFADGSVRVFSRNGDETTSRFPDLLNIVKEASKTAAVTFILDAEIVAVDRKNSCKLMSFQELSSRERGSKDIMVTMDSIKVDICIFVFDIMFANGEQLLGSPLRKRRQYLKELFPEPTSGYFEYAREMTVEASEACLTNESTLAKINVFLEDALQFSCEGIMFKSLDFNAGYIPSKRSDAWLKVKRDYVEGLNDSLDLVPIGAWHGNGRKAGWHSPFLMACYNPDSEEYQSVCRVMSGFSDTFYRQMKEYFSEDRILSRKPPYYRTAEVPDVWFTPNLVWEIRGADFTISPIHQAAVGLIHPSRGISIRFPRFISSVSDRSPEECSTAADIVDMYNSQTRKMDVTAED